MARARCSPRDPLTRKVCLVMAGPTVLAVVTTAHPSAWKGHLARQAEAGLVPETSRWYRLAEYIRETSRRMIGMRVLSAHTDAIEASAAEARAVVHYRPRFTSGIVRRNLPDRPEESAEMMRFRENLSIQFPGVSFSEGTISAMFAAKSTGRQRETSAGDNLRRLPATPLARAGETGLPVCHSDGMDIV